MSSADNNHEQLLHVFPEQFSKGVLLKKLQEHGLEEETLQKIEDSIQDVILCFHKNLASLPRRLPRCNRRGKLMKKCHEAEDKSRQLKAAISVTKFSAKSLSVLKKSEKSAKSLFSHPSVVQQESTPEMDRLLARSKAAATAKRKPEIPSTTLPLKKIAKISDVSKEGAILKTVSGTQNQSVNPCTKSSSSVTSSLHKNLLDNGVSNIFIKNNDKSSKGVASTVNTTGKHVIKLKRPLKEIKKLGDEKTLQSKKKRKLNRNSFASTVQPIREATN